MSNKKGPLSKVEKFYIENRYREDGVDSLFKDLERAKSTVKRHITKCKDKERDDIEQQFSAGALFAQSNGAVIMTQGASEYGDAVKGTTKVMPRRQANCVTTTNKIDE